MADYTEEETRKLLEMAAKAAGFNIPHGRYDFQRGFEVMREHNMPFWWNPLNNDGDALRLANKLRITIHHDDLSPTVSACADCVTWIDEPHCDDVNAATRRAIVRAAAEIGRNHNG